jgi:hypothetical protein
MSAVRGLVGPAARPRQPANAHLARTPFLVRFPDKWGNLWGNHPHPEVVARSNAAAASRSARALRCA